MAQCNVCCQLSSFPHQKLAASKAVKCLRAALRQAAKPQTIDMHVPQLCGIRQVYAMPMPMLPCAVDQLLEVSVSP